jgi:hypothetical protein
MGSRSILNLVLAAVVIALAWLSLTSDEEARPDSGMPVTTLAPDDIASIHIEADGRRPVSLTRVEQAWRVSDPYQAPADPFRVNALLGLATATSDKGFRAAGNDLTQFGLEPPRATVRFDGHVLHLGITDPVENLRYVRSGDQVHLLQDHWFSQVFGEAAAWLDPRPLGGATTLLAITLPDSRWQRRPDGWQRSPTDPGSSAGAGPLLAEAWQHARALSVRAMDPSAPWSGQVSITLTETQPPVVFEIAETRDSVLFGNARLQVQYRFLPRQGDALLGRSPTD